MSKSPKTGEEGAQSGFPATRWTRVLAARGESTEAKSALSALCAAYYKPVKSFIHYSVRDGDGAPVEDLAQEFFATLLARSGVAGAERGRGKFRSYLLGAVKHFLADWRDRERAAKRGGGKEIVSLDEALTTAGGERSESLGAGIPDEEAEIPDAYFDRQWALTVLDRALGELLAVLGDMDPVVDSPG